MKNVFKLLQSLNERNIQFKLEEVGDDEGNIRITTDSEVFITENYEHELYEVVGDKLIIKTI